MARLLYGLVRAGGRSYPEALEAGAEIQRDGLKRALVMTRELLPDFVRHLTEEARLASFAKLARLAALALDYRTAHGSFPSARRALADDSDGAWDDVGTLDAHG